MQLHMCDGDFLTCMCLVKSDVAAAHKRLKSKYIHRFLGCQFFNDAEGMNKI